MTDSSLPSGPTIASPWSLLFRPEKTGCYINDHSVVPGPDGRWHLFGITGRSERPAPNQERWFAHAAGPVLDGSVLLEEIGPVCDDGVRAWAPCVVQHQAQFFMYYGPSPTKLALSRNLRHWMGATPVFTDTPPEAVHRDHMIIRRDDGTWLLYATGLDEDGLGGISVCTSTDLLHWKFAGWALRTRGQAALRPAWGATESPFVFRRDGWHYLAITYTDCQPKNDHDTLLFRSRDPLNFGVFDADTPETTVIQRYRAHAPEFLHDSATDRWFITTCGWRGYKVPHEGGVSIAALVWP